MYRIYIRDSQFRRIGEITDYTKLDLIPRFNNVGSFVLDLPTDSYAAKELTKPKHGLIVTRDGKHLFSGTVTSRKRSFSSSGDSMIISGKDDMQFLANRLAYPVPSADFSLADYDVRTGKAETIMKEYVSFNTGPETTISSRRDLTIEADRGLGDTITGRARFQNLLEFLSSLALKGGGLGFKVVHVEESLQFQVYQPTDKTKSAFFSPLLGNLSSFEYSNDNPEANFVIVGGGGEGKNRIIQWKGDSESITKYGRIETFADRRDTSDINELNESVDEELVTKSEQNSFSFTPIDTPQLSFGKDYALGDKVSIVLTQPNEVIDIETLHYFISTFQTVPVQLERVRKIQEKLDVIQDIVREVKISITPDGEIINPVVGTEDSKKHLILGIFDKMKQLTSRIHHLERR